VQLQPRYGNDPIITMDGPGSSVRAPAVRQRRRLAATLAGFDEAQWQRPTRCDGWATRHVVAHLNDTNSFWAFSISSALAGEPTRFLADFDPVASPPALIASAEALGAEELLERFEESTRRFTELLESLEDAAWSTLAEAPPGHISVSALVHHALWDSWVHERDVLLPLGLDHEVHDDEVAACVRYAASLSPAFALSLGQVRTGRLAVSLTDPELSFVVDVDGRAAVREGFDEGADLVLQGDAVEVLEALSQRGPRPLDAPDDTAWLLSGLAIAFDAEEAQPA